MKQLTAIILTALIWACGAQPQNDSRALEPVSYTHLTLPTTPYV